MRQVIPLGLFGTLSGNSRFSRNAEEIKKISGQVPVDEHAHVAEYLRTAPVIIALMGYTEDVVGQEFSVMGGSALHSDGTYYWRRDTADYVEIYGTLLPAEFMEHGTKTEWHAPFLTDIEIMEIDDYFMSLRTQS
ncbi:hypothetical protein [Streptomyces sp. NPDC127033]|uniref:hypothetical protein n=1 Tax=Streptomyces sp. NPDC127033 TaxID=3347110 RepID=UPI00365DF013